MLVFWKENLVFLATTKTGSTAVEEALAGRADIAFLNPPRLKHMRARRFQNRYLHEFFPDSPGRVETVAVMREPLDWLGSWYRYRARPALAGKPNSTAEVGFDDFARAYMSDDPPPYARVGSQFRFLTDAGGAPLVTHLFDHARMEQLYGFLEERLGVEVPRQRRNVSPRQELPLGAATEVALRRFLAPDIALYESVREAAGRRAR